MCTWFLSISHFTVTGEACSKKNCIFEHVRPFVYVWNCLGYLCTCHLIPLGPVEGLEGHEGVGAAPKGLRRVLPQQESGCASYVWGLSDIHIHKALWFLPILARPFFVSGDSAGIFALALVWSPNSMQRRHCALLSAHSLFTLFPSISSPYDVYKSQITSPVQFPCGRISKS